ncbi:MAG: hypothetical protein GXP55_04700 [Deltaproteobacteria bacterium]|nr:hypothetical protein [Deltaproteobacteria bacterium]
MLLIAFERLRVAISMLWVALLAMCAVFAGLWITHTALNISSMMGMTMVEVGVFYVMETARPAHVALDRALIDAGVARVRPIRVSNDHAFMCSRDVSAARARGRWGIRTGTYGAVQRTHRASEGAVRDRLSSFGPRDIVVPP